MAANYSIRVLERAANILSCFTVVEPEKYLVDITRETGLHKSTVFRILETLKELNWVKQDPKTSFYRLGFGLFVLGSKTVNGLDLYKVSRPHMEKLVRETGQTAHLVIHDNGEVLYLNKIEYPGTLVTQPSIIGARSPMHCTACGKVLLAFAFSKEDIDNLLNKRPLKKVTGKTVVSKKKLLESLEEVRQKGYAIDDEEIQIGLRCVAAPLRDCMGNVAAAISVSGLTSVFNDENLLFLAEKVTESAKEISKDQGYSGGGALG